MAERAVFQRVGSARFARNPRGLGVVEFYGGALFERWPQLFYDAYLQGLFDAGYHIVAMTFPISFNHTRVAMGLIEVRREVFAALKLPDSKESFPHFWVAHSIGCKIVALLQALLSTGIECNARQPTLLLAPDISGTAAAVPRPLAALLDALGLGVQPTESQSQSLLAGRIDVLSATALISFAEDSIAGNAAGTLPVRGGSSVKWFVDTLAARRSADPLPFFLNTEMPGRHLAPLGFEFEGRSRAVAAGVSRKIRDRRSVAGAGMAPLLTQSLIYLDLLRAQIPRGSTSTAH